MTYQMKNPPTIGEHVVVHSYSGRVYIGTLCSYVDDPSPDVILSNVMEFGMTMGPQGPAFNVKDPDFAQGPIGEMVLNPAVMYALSEAGKEMKSKMLEFIQQARAKAAGIVMPGSGLATPHGRH